MVHFFSGSDPDLINKKITGRLDRLLTGGGSEGSFYDNYILPNFIFILIFIVLIIILICRYFFKPAIKKSENFKTNILDNLTETPTRDEVSWLGAIPPKNSDYFDF